MRSFGLRFALAALFSALLLSGCPASENVLLLEVTSQADVDTLEVIAIDAMGRRAGELNVRVGRTRDDINNNEPIRVVVPVGPGGAITVFVRAESPAGAGSVSMLATRCYVVNGVVRDDVLLVQIDASLDVDGDGFPFQPSVTCRDLGDGGMAIACDVGMCPDGTAGDCDDADPDRFPGNDVICMDGIDQNCRNDGLATDDEPCDDLDEDGWTSCGPGAAAGTCDCADDNPMRNPDIVEDDMMLCNDAIDQNCDGRDELCDLDGDGFPANVPTGGAPDCDDTNNAINPDATELCDDRIDNNCNRLIDEGAACAPDDLDRDGSVRCPSTGTPDCTTCDCNDCNGAIHPSAAAICDGLDQISGAIVPATGDPFADCPGDTDGDGQVAPRDCNVNDRLAYTGAPENCMSPELEGCVASGVCAGTDNDMDGYVSAQDCNDMNPMVSPAAAEDCDSVDNDCDGVVNELNAAAGNVGCIFDPTSCMGDGACRIDFFAAMGDTRHCGGCALDCNPDATNVVADQCLGGVCDCSTEGGTAACAATDTCCGGAAPGCANLDTDHDNCGSCGVVCGVANSDAPECVNGDCICAAAGAVCGAATPNCCGSGCVDLANDPNNCGVCGHECGAGATCSSGTCSCVSPDTADCNGDLNRPDRVLVSDGCEVRIDQATQCGSCGNSCFTAQVAMASCGGSPGARSCTIDSCNGGFGNCDGATGNGCEVNLNSVAECGTSCATRVNCASLTGVSSATCTAGACGITSCNGGVGNCDGTVGNGCETNLFVPTSCGLTCGGRSDCSALPNVATGTCPGGTCGIGTCDGGFADCAGGAADGCETNLNAVATCGASCAARVDCNGLPQVTTGTCTGGVCGIMSCDPGFGDCGGGASNGCETNFNAVTSCGSGCGSLTNCSALPNVGTATCGSGTCSISTCSSGFGDCSGGATDGCETNLNSPSACGTTCAGRSDCNALANVLTGSCSAGTCGITTCDAGFGDCSGGAANGCETNLNDVTSCGPNCGARVNCTALTQVATSSCTAGACGISTCNSGRGNCDGMVGNGCETNLNAPTSCGANCGARVDCDALPHVATGTCTTGACGIGTCDAGWANCDGMVNNGCETDTTTTADCGACGNTCGTYSGGARVNETCAPSGGNYRCTCGSTIGAAGAEACTGSNVCCAGSVNACTSMGTCS